jgi:hypothetical protein
MENPVTPNFQNYSIIERMIFIANQKKFDMRMTEQDYKRLTRKARKCGLTRSGYIRLLIHDYNPREAPPADYFGMTRELKEIGDNMKQIAFMANATGLVDEGRYYEEVMRLRDALQRIEQAVVGQADKTDFEDKS